MHLTFADFDWHVVWVAPGCERKVWRELHDLDLAPYFPRLPSGDPLWRGYVFMQADSWRPTEWENVHDIDGVRKIMRESGGSEKLFRLGGMQLESAILGEILEVIRKACPSDPLFVSRRKQRQEARYRQYLARQRAA